MDLSLATFALASLVVVTTPGPTVLLALSNGSRFGLAAASYGIAGAALSDMVLILAAAVGLGALLSASAFWFSVVKWIGVVYLIWVGVQMIRAAGTSGALPDRSMTAGPESRRLIFRKSFLVAVTNPKGYLFFTAFLPQFLMPSEPLLPQYVILALTFVVVDIAVMSIYAGLGFRAARFLREAGAKWIDRSCGVLLILLGGALALVRRSDL
ncbi:MAG: LysE family translocator [Tabrizicola sp.]|jgi:threonine/homoserine/homoserine lactone efflux protein|nr:LysE family translocator [Tabrizicola sp.]